jgi:amino acid transporter
MLAMVTEAPALRGALRHGAFWPGGIRVEGGDRPKAGRRVGRRPEFHPRFRTLVFGILLIGIVGPAALFLDVATSPSFINFGAFSAFTLVNLSEVAHFVRTRPQCGAWALLAWIVIPLAGAAVDFYLLTRLDIHAAVFGMVWLVVGVLLSDPRFTLGHRPS